MILHESVEQDLVLIPQRGKESVFENDRGLLLSVLASFLFTKANGIAIFAEHTTGPRRRGVDIGRSLLGFGLTFNSWFHARKHCFSSECTS